MQVHGARNRQVDTTHVSTTHDASRGVPDEERCAALQASKTAQLPRATRGAMPFQCPGAATHGVRNELCLAKITVSIVLYLPANAHDSMSHCNLNDEDYGVKSHDGFSCGADFLPRTVNEHRATAAARRVS